MAVSRLTIRTRAKNRADMTNSEFVGDAEWNDYINEGLAELHELIANKYDDYQVCSETITLVSDQEAYELPSNFMRIRGVDVVSSGRSYTLEPFMFQERNRLHIYEGVRSTGTRYMYQVVGSNLRLIPTPISAGGTITLWYVPSAKTLINDESTIDPSYEVGWERYIVLYAAIRALQKEESLESVQLAMAEQQGLQRKIEASATQNAGSPKRVVDTRYSREFWR